MGKSKGQMKSRLSYSAGAFGNDVFYATLSTYFIMFVTTHLFNTGDPKQNSHYVLLITNIIAILRILEVFIDPLIGNMIVTLSPFRSEGAKQINHPLCGCASKVIPS